MKYFYTLSIALCVLYLACVLYECHNPTRYTAMATIGHYEMHRSYSVYDASYQKEFPWQKWKIRNRKLMVKN